MFRGLVFGSLALAHLILGACGQKIASYEPRVSTVGQDDVVYFDLNCRDGDLDACNQIAISTCRQEGLNVRVTNHYVSGSEVSQLTFYCSAQAQQLMPENITFDDS